MAATQQVFPEAAFVTGATGFLGSHVARQLAEAGVDVRVLARPGAKMDALESVDVTVIEGGLEDEKALAKGMKNADWVFHVAASVNMWKNRWAMSHRVNVLGTRAMVQSALKNGVKRFVHTSTVSTIGKPVGSNEDDVATVDENTTYNLEEFSMTYPHTKWLAEQEVKTGLAQGLFAVITHPSMIVGPGDVNVNIGRYLMEAKKNRMVLAPDSFTNLCDVRDVARGHILAAQKGGQGEHYIFSAHTVPAREFYAACAELTGGVKPLFTLPTGVLMGLGRLMDALGDLTGEEPLFTTEMAQQGSLKFHIRHDKAARELGYTTRPWRESLEDSHAWYAGRGMI